MTNHDHLGKLLTYVANLDAKIAIWIAPNHRAEHVRSVQWLNEMSPDDVQFFVIKLAAYRISGSEIAAPLFTLIVGPSAETKSFGKQKKDLAERHVTRLRFWEGLLAMAKRLNVTYHAQRSPTKDNWLDTGAGVQSGLKFIYLIWMKGSAVELYIDTQDGNFNQTILRGLHEHREAIEGAFGAPLSWEDSEDMRARRVRYVLPEQRGLKDEESWPDIQGAMIDAMDHLVKAIRPYLARP